MDDNFENETRDFRGENETIVEIGRRFANGLQAGGAEAIEHLLDRVELPVRDRLLRHLIAIEVMSLRSRGQSVTVDDYLRRFPGSDEVLTAFDDLSDQPLDLEQAPSADDALGPEDLETPRTIRQFQLGSLIGRGGFGVVWKAFDTTLHRNVAVKIPRRDGLSRESLSRFLEEARVIATLRHPNIVPVYEVGEIDGSVFIVTDLIDGPSLKVRLREWRPTIQQAADFVSKAARALEHAHERGIVHRDLKPGNILIDSAGNPHIVDFGLAKHDLKPAPAEVDRAIVGTPQYMAPEQAAGSNALIDRRTDLYSLGTVLYELLTGRTPFRGEVSVLLREIAAAAPPLPRTLNPSVPRDLESICLKCLAKEPAERYQTARALAEDLEHFLAGETLSGVPVPTPRKVRQWVKRNRRSLLTSTATLALGAAGVVMLRPSEQEKTSERRVELTTSPPGCKVTVVPISATGDPDPAGIRTLKGRTPLTTSLPPGDYLVVAVHEEGQVKRWHEVWRHVPFASERFPSVYPLLSWQILDDGRVRLPKISLPEPGKPSDMRFVDAGEVTTSPNGPFPGERTRIPPFFTDRSLATGAAFSAAQVGLTPAIIDVVDDVVACNFVYAHSLAERMGKRLPTVAEYTRDLATADGSASEPWSSSPDKKHQYVWTTNRRRGVPDEPVFVGVGLGFRRRIAISIDDQNASSVTQRSRDLTESSFATMKFVRSARPRLTPSDFPQLVRTNPP